MRKSEIKRNTTETQIKVKLELDGSGVYDIETGIGFLDHMLEQLAKHSLLNLYIRAKGDLHIDMHHTTEDTGIAIGMALKQALGDMRGINRFAHSFIPMDETLTRAAIDISGRPYLVWNVQFSQPKIGEMDTELFKEWFQAFAQNAGITLHIENIYGTNNHHIIESCFKALAKAIKQAITIDDKQKNILPSTKGKIGD